MAVRIDVVIPTNNRDHRLPRVVTPLLEDPAVSRIIIVNDAAQSAPESRKPDVAALSDRIEVISSRGVGPAKARQRGAERASAEVLLFLDDDVVPAPGLASRHARHHEEREGLLISGYTPVVARPGRRVSPEAAVYGVTYEKRCFEYETNQVGVLTNLWGGNFSLRRKDAEAVGLASADFTEAWHEDRDFGLRCMEAGLSAVFDRNIRADHEYERVWGAVAAESYRRGYSLVVLHRLHRSIIGPLEERHFERGRPYLVRLLVRLSAFPTLRRLAVRGLYLLRWAGGRLRLWRLQLATIRMLRLMQSAAGARDAA